MNSYPCSRFQIHEKSHRMLPARSVPGNRGSELEDCWYWPEYKDWKAPHAIRAQVEKVAALRSCQPARARIYASSWIDPFSRSKLPFSTPQGPADNRCLLSGCSCPRQNRLFWNTLFESNWLFRAVCSKPPGYQGCWYPGIAGLYSPPALESCVLRDYRCPRRLHLYQVLFRLKDSSAARPQFWNQGLHNEVPGTYTDSVRPSYPRPWLPEFSRNDLSMSSLSVAMMSDRGNWCIDDEALVPRISAAWTIRHLCSPIP